MQVILLLSARKYILSLPGDIQERITSKIEFFSRQENITPFAKHIGGKFYRFRVGDYRVIFYIKNNVLYVDEIERRDKVYK